MMLTLCMQSLQQAVMFEMVFVAKQLHTEMLSHAVVCSHRAQQDEIGLVIDGHCCLLVVSSNIRDCTYCGTFAKA